MAWRPQNSGAEKTRVSSSGHGPQNWAAAAAAADATDAADESDCEPDWDADEDEDRSSPEPLPLPLPLPGAFALAGAADADPDDDGTAPTVDSNDAAGDVLCVSAIKPPTPAPPPPLPLMLNPCAAMCSRRRLCSSSIVRITTERAHSGRAISARKRRTTVCRWCARSVPDVLWYLVAQREDGCEGKRMRVRGGMHAWDEW